MTTRKSTKRALLLSALSLLLCVSMLVGSTFAWFTDSVTSAGNKIQSGTLKVDLELLENGAWNSLKETKAPVFTYEKWEPGYTDVKIFKIENEGSLALKWYAKFVTEAEESILADVIDVYVKPSATELAYPADRNLDGYTKVGTLSQFLDTISTTTYGSLLAGEEAYLGIALKMQETAGNEYQDKTIGAFDIQILATQYTYEEDSFDEYYDTDATYPVTATVDRKDVNAKNVLSAGGVTITVKEGTPTGVYTLDVSNATKSTDENGKTYLGYNINLLKDGVKVEPDGVTVYPVDIKVGKGLDVEEVLHNGEAIAAFEYDPNGESVTFETASFSPFAVVCEVLPQGDFYVANGQQLQEAVLAVKEAQGGDEDNAPQMTIVLTDDILFDASSEFAFTDSAGAHVYLYHVNLCLNLNGHDIANTADALKAGKTNATALILVRYCNLEIVGEGNIISRNKSSALYNWAHSDVVIRGGNFISNAVERTESAVYTNNTSAKMHVYGGTYLDTDFGFNTHNTSCVGTVITLHEGVKFFDYKDHFVSDYNGGRIAIAEGCSFVKSEVDGKTMYEIVAE